MSGINALPFESEQVEIAVSSVFTVLATMWAWWKNNSVTKEAKEADNILKNKKVSKIKASR